MNHIDKLKVIAVEQMLDNNYHYQTDVERLRKTTFMNSHSRECDGVMILKYTYSPIGTNTYVVCSCGKEENITEYEAW